MYAHMSEHMSIHIFRRMFMHMTMHISIHIFEALYRLYIGLGDGIPISRVWACRYSK